MSEQTTDWWRVAGKVSAIVAYLVFLHLFMLAFELFVSGELACTGYRLSTFWTLSLPVVLWIWREA